ncbi:MAG: hypothetical protein VR73_01535 [Gammaproteobacteria bacterium BRH_c0]|nr:MAG: hypothetical protein VR73_01535 [Gammaproteobacteria bacterium BRH_c0]
MNNSHLIRPTVRWHRLLGWSGGIALIIFGLSGLTHPLMTWFGPQQAAFFPPQGQFAGEDIAAIPAVLGANGVAQAQLVKVTPTARGNLLQITLDNGINRRYFSLDNGAELPEFDRSQAEWLARYYTGLADTPIRSMALQTTFDNAYPSVNRLLPVWRVAFETDDNLTAFVHTELNALASLTNNTKTLQQTVFQALHTWNWLDSLEPARVLIVLLLVGSLAILCLTGMVMVLIMPRRKLRGTRRWHRALAWGIWLPLLAFSISGLYHLLHNAGDSGPAGLAYGPAINLANQKNDTAATDWIDGREAQPLNSITLLSGPDGQILYRLGMPSGKPHQAVDHHARFNGTPTENPPRLIDAASGSISSLSDQELARFAATRHLGISAEDISASAIVTGFGPEYDFRNKRLPVWRVDHAQGTAFIDPANGALVDHVSRADGYEGLSFSHLHKWNFMTPFVGRQIRDGLVTLVIVIALVFGVLGFVMLVRRRGNA